MAYTQSDIAAIERAIATGTRVVQYADRRVEYQSLADLTHLLDRMRAESTPRQVPLGRAWTAVQDGRGFS